MKQWFCARLLFESVHDPPERPSKLSPLFEESYVVFRAGEDESIEGRLLEIAHGMEHNYEAAAGNQVYWTFREILEVQEISTDKETLEDGMEVFYRWWHNPGPRAFKIMRDTHQGRAWWLDDYVENAEAKRTKR
jgi:hypothetical protein